MSRFVIEYELMLELDDFLVVRITKEKGKIIEFAIIYYTDLDGIEHNIYQVDCEHGYPHAHKNYTKKKNT